MRSLGLVVWAVASSVVFACDCRAPKPACAYVGADAIFLGRVVFTNHDDGGGISQGTLVQFEVQERFKGVATDVKYVWVDPGSFSSCYENYKLGKEYLIVAMRRGGLPSDTTIVTLLGDRRGLRKPVPPGFNPKSPPPVLWAPECSGSRPADYPRIDIDLNMLRTYRSGGTLPRVIGDVYLYPYLGWPTLKGPVVAGARVDLLNETTTLRAIADEHGRFTLSAAPAGIYRAWAKAPPYQMAQMELLHVPERGCGYVDVMMKTVSTVSGIVLNQAGEPAARIPVWLESAAPDWDDITGYGLRAETDSGGRFTFDGVPDEEMTLYAGRAFPRTDQPHKLVSYSKTIHLKPGEHNSKILLWLDRPLQAISVTLQLKKRNGSPAAGAKLWAFDDRDVVAEQSVADANGVAKLNCLSGLKYNLKSFDYFPTKHPMSKAPFRCEAGKVVTYFEDELEAVRRGK